jgi:hypothetical protein
MSAIRPAARRAAALAAAGLLAAAIAGCGSKPAASVSAPAGPARPAPLETSYTDAAGTSWAIVEMGGSAAQEENFWELFTRPPGATSWREATPEGVADNGGLVVTGSGGAALLTTGFLPSQDLTFSPLAATSDNGASWSQAGPVNPGLASSPDALASGPGGRLLALTSGGSLELGTGSGTAWTRLASGTTLAGTAAGQACGLTGLTAAAFGGAAGTPMLAAGCGHPGVAGIFAESDGAWHAAGPGRLALPGPLARQDIDVVRLAATSSGVVALLRAGTGRDETLAAAWSPGTDGPWKVSPPLRLGPRQLVSTTVGPGWAVGVILSGGRAETLTGPDATAWRTLPALPRWAATLALGPSGQADAIAAHGGTFQDYRLGAAGWGLAQTLKVTIPYGSSG